MSQDSDASQIFRKIFVTFMEFCNKVSSLHIAIQLLYYIFFIFILKACTESAQCVIHIEVCCFTSHQQLNMTESVGMKHRHSNKSSILQCWQFQHISDFLVHMIPLANLHIRVFARLCWEFECEYLEQNGLNLICHGHGKTTGYIISVETLFKIGDVCCP